MGTSEDFLHLTTHYAVYEIMSVCMCLKQQTDDLYIIICVVINPLSKSVALQVGRSGFILLKLTFPTWFRVVVAQHGMDVMLSGGLAKGRMGGARD